MKRQLIGIGYWHSIYETDFPDPGYFVDREWDKAERERIIQYLQSGQLMPYDAMGVSWCRFRCGINHLGAGEFTDGKYVWPEGLAHYVTTHDVKLPNDVIDHMVSNKTFIPIDNNPEVDWTWWKKQRGFNTSITTINDPLDIGLLSIVQKNSKQKLKQGDLLRTYLLDSYGVKGRLQAIDKIMNGEQAKIKGRYRDVDTFISKAASVGLDCKFERLTREAYDLD
jgi:hypothetical protein